MMQNTMEEPESVVTETQQQQTEFEVPEAPQIAQSIVKNATLHCKKEGEKDGEQEEKDDAEHERDQLENAKQPLEMEQQLDAEQRVQDENQDEQDKQDGGGKESAAADPRKLFIGGLHPGTTEQRLRDYFAQFGAIKDSMVMRDLATQRSRGFGFVTFQHRSSVTKVLYRGAPHLLDSKQIDPKIAVPKQFSQMSKPLNKIRKIFIGGISSSTTKEKIQSFFQQFGVLESCELMLDKTSNQHRGFGFVTYESEQDAQRVCQQHYYEIDKKLVEVKKALPKEILGAANVIVKQQQQHGLLKSSLNLKYLEAATTHLPAAHAMPSSICSTLPRYLLHDIGGNLSGVPTSIGAVNAAAAAMVAAAASNLLSFPHKSSAGTNNSTSSSTTATAGSVITTTCSYALFSSASLASSSSLLSASSANCNTSNSHLINGNAVTWCPLASSQINNINSVLMQQPYRGENSSESVKIVSTPTKRLLTSSGASLNTSHNFGQTQALNFHHHHHHLDLPVFNGVKNIYEKTTITTSTKNLSNGEMGETAPTEVRVGINGGACSFASSGSAAGLMPQLLSHVSSAPAVGAPSTPLNSFLNNLHTIPHPHSHSQANLSNLLNFNAAARLDSSHHSIITNTATTITSSSTATPSAAPLLNPMAFLLGNGLSSSPTAGAVAAQQYPQSVQTSLVPPQAENHLQTPVFYHQHYPENALITNFYAAAPASNCSSVPASATRSQTESEAARPDGVGGAGGVGGGDAGMMMMMAAAAAAGTGFGAGSADFSAARVALDSNFTQLAMSQPFFGCTLASPPQTHTHLATASSLFSGVPHLFPNTRRGLPHSISGGSELVGTTSASGFYSSEGVASLLSPLTTTSMTSLPLHTLLAVADAGNHSGFASNYGVSAAPPANPMIMTTLTTTIPVQSSTNASMASASDRSSVESEFAVHRQFRLDQTQTHTPNSMLIAKQDATEPIWYIPNKMSRVH